MAYVRTSGGPKHLFVSYNGKIADITHADTLTHLLTLANGAGTGAIAGETRKNIALIISSYRMAGTGNLRVYPNEGAGLRYTNSDYSATDCVIANGTQRLQYSLSVANDDFDLYCWGYIVET